MTSPGDAAATRRRSNLEGAEERYSRALLVVPAIAAGAPVQSQTPWRLAPAEMCLGANRDPSLGAPLPRVAARFRSDDPVTVVAIGSSSTVGLRVLNRDRTFPGVMRRELARLRPNSRLAVVNSGRIGDTIPGNVARFRRDVFRYRPDLVIWQVGTNDVVWGGRTDGLKAWLVHGVRALKARGADVVLMDLQYAPMVLASSPHPRMQAIIAETARQERVGLFSRFSLEHDPEKLQTFRTRSCDKPEE